MNTSLQTEATIVSRYLIGRHPSAKVVQFYTQAVSAGPTLQANEQSLLSFITKHPWSLQFIDSGLALVRPQSEIRRRLYIMFAILEAMPEYAPYFLPRQRSGLYILVVGMVGIRAVAKALLGVVMVKVVR